MTDPLDLAQVGVMLFAAFVAGFAGPSIWSDVRTGVGQARRIWRELNERS